MDVGNIVYSIELSDGTMSVNYHKILHKIGIHGESPMRMMYIMQDGKSFMDNELYTDFEKALDECLK